MKNSLLSRFALNIFWLARYMERTDSLARRLEVTETHSRDEHGTQDWELMLNVNSDLERYKKQYKKITPENVIHFYSIDKTNPTSMITSVTNARENARSLRHLISTEMWAEINALHNFFASVKKRDIQTRRFSGFCDSIKERCQAHSGITEATLYRDQAYNFYWMGKLVERADQASRLLDVGFTRAQKLGYGDADAGENLSHWTALLRSVGGYQAYRRTHPIHLRSHEITDFILLNISFPRSVNYCIEEIRDNMVQLIDSQDVENAREAMQALEIIRKQLAGADVQLLVTSGLHEFADTLQQQLTDFTQVLAKGCFGQDG